MSIFNRADYIRYQEQNPQKVEEYLEQIKDIPAEKIAYVDEFGIDTYLYREYGYSPQGRRIFWLVCGKKYKRLGIVAAKIGNKILAPLQYSGTMNSKFFEFCFSDQLLPSLKILQFFSKIGACFMPIGERYHLAVSSCKSSGSPSS